jgi:diguanylate cyclase (GGDEF)-like protein
VFQAPGDLGVTFLTPSYDLRVVAASFFIASFASYVALDLTSRVRTSDRRLARRWWASGSIAMGTGIWSMHFIGMLAFSLPITLGYTAAMTAISWFAGVAVSAVALGAVMRQDMDWRHLAGGAVAMGVGICTMHYSGMAALDMTPGIVWNWPLVGASVMIAVSASAVALNVFKWFRGGKRSRVWQLVAALVLGAAICGMHYTGMGAAEFPSGAVCRSADGLNGERLGMLVTVSSLMLLTMTLYASTVDARMEGRTVRLAASLKTANDELQAANEALKQRALTDPLTSLPNRVLFEDRLAQACKRRDRAAAAASKAAGAREVPRFAVLFVDLDGFKPVNDVLGHAAGDQVLQEAARRLRVTGRDNDTVARIGGDEFLLLAEGLGGVADATALADRLVKRLARAFEVDGRRVHVSASIGVVVYPDNGQREQLVTRADAAMYAAKRAGGNTRAVFEPRMDEAGAERLNLHSELRMAIERGQLKLHYQPKIDSTTGQIRGVEALLRWTHPERGSVSPVVFIPIAERFGLINEIGNWVIDEVCRQLHEWADEGMRTRVAINLSVHQLRQDDLVDRIEAALKRHALDPSQLLCEVTESVAMGDPDTLQRVFDGLARIGVFISIDDFGTGYSCLINLRQLPAAQLKIDRSFINDIETSKDALAIVSAVVNLAHALGLKVVAEGVETAGQRDILIGMNCDEMQGFYFARPMAAESLHDWFLGNKPEGAVDFAPSAMLEYIPT